jgi:penicillin-binding protein 2
MVLEHNGHTVRNLDSPLIARDIMTYLFDKDRAMASLVEGEKSWGGDIQTRMAATAASYRAAQAPPPAAIATKTDAIVPSDAPAVENATDQANATQAALVTPGNTVAEDGTSEREP